MRKTIMLAGAAAVLLAAARLAHAGQQGADEWGAYGRDLQGTRFSPLTQVTPENVAKLKPAWTFHTGDISTGKVKGGGPRSGFETTPLMMDGRLYLTTPFNRVIALDPATGKELWAYDPKLDRDKPYGDGLINRGLAAWRDAKAGKGACALRLYEATLDARLVSVDAATGLPCPGFGVNGEVNLRDVARYTPGQYHMTSPPIALDGVVVVGSAIDDNSRVSMPSGVVRVYQADSKGGLQFVGEDRIDHTPKDETLNLKIGNAFDVVCERKQIDFEKISAGTYEVEYEITLRNHKANGVNVAVNEPIGGTWRMLQSSHEWKKTSAWAAQFAVPVAQDGTAVLKYRVRVTY